MQTHWQIYSKHKPQPAVMLLLVNHDKKEKYWYQLGFFAAGWNGDEEINLHLKYELISDWA